MSEFLSWGRYPRLRQEVRRLEWPDERIDFSSGNSYLPYGLGRSYGDSCLNEGGVLLVSSGLNRLISFDPCTGLLECEAGVSLAEVLRFAVPRGWFLPVTPGTKFVTVGGAIANDVHGKNHHCAGTFGRYIRELTLLRSDGERLLCRPDLNEDLFRATIGGLGLTGLITRAVIQLKPVPGPWIERESLKFRNLDEFFEISGTSGDFEYSVAWLDSANGGSSFGRGIFFRGNHAAAAPDARPPFRPRLMVPITLPGFTLNRFTVGAFNFCYFNSQLEKIKRSLVHYDPFFYPLDTIENWNRIYGPNGLLQFQCVLTGDYKETLRELLRKIVASGRSSFLTVLKEFGDLVSPGMISFPRKGVTLALDFPNSAQTRKLLSTLEGIVRDSGGALYPAKDALMTSASFEAAYPKWRQFASFIDPKFSSSFWRRVCPAGS